MSKRKEKFDDKTGTDPRLRGKSKEKKMTFKERIENDPIAWLIGVAFTAFITGIGAYQGILEIAKLEVVQKDAYVKREDFDSLKIKFDKLKVNYDALKTATVAPTEKLLQSTRKDTTEVIPLRPK